MPRARKHIVCVEETPYYHVTSRCVRRAFLCGEDRYTGRSYEHRRGWIEDRVRVLSSLFSIEICAYAVMSNHYHLVVRLDPAEAASWSDDEVLDRWTALFRGPLLLQQYCTGRVLSDVEQDSLRSMTRVFRNRLASLSWFMKCLNEPIARNANAEDGCKGHFWEARFHSQPLRSDKALLSAMAYVDLNPIRARVAPTPEESDYTSLKVRLADGDQRSRLAAAMAGLLERGEIHHFDVPLRPLMPFSERRAQQVTSKSAATLPMREAEYLKLVDETGRIVVRRERGRIDPALLPVLERLGLSDQEWLQGSTAFQEHYRNGDLRKIA